MAYINQISTANPGSAITQSDIGGFMTTAMQLNEEDERKLKAIFRLSGIQSRHSVISDYAFKEDKNWTFYPKVSEQKLLGTAERMNLYQQHALPLVKTALVDILEEHASADFTHLITVSCTGMFAPGLDIQLIKTCGLQPSIERTSIQFMGCFAAINALKTARHICESDKGAKVLIICVELCTIHFQAEFNEDNLLANTLFGDGAACVVVTNKAENSLYKITGFESIVDDDSESEMAWHIGNLGFEMKLTSYVPNIIEKRIEKLTNILVTKFQLTLGDIHHYAIHPGGKRILDAVEKGLDLPKYVNEVAHEVLQKFGNMSSPTVLFVLEGLRKKIESNKNVLSFAFGPGLTMESMLLKSHG
ncbi:MAG: alpha-pyrone synthase [Marivirga sp.]|jgi:alpha-pyrone synthase